MIRKKLNILLADDDVDDRFFFEKALKLVCASAALSTVEDGPGLMEFLSKAIHLPDVLFLDLNMPRKNGAECLLEIKQNGKFKNLPVIIYSTSLHDELANILYQRGAHYYIRKTTVENLEKVLSKLLPRMIESNFARPTRDQFVLTLPILK